MIRNYRQIGKTGSQVTFIGVGKTQGGAYALIAPKLNMGLPRFKHTKILNPKTPNVTLSYHITNPEP